MAHNNGIITAPVSFGDVNATLGTSHTDLGNLCKDLHINKWAIFKALKNSLMDTTPQFNYTNHSWKSDSTWWLGNFTGERWGMNFTIERGIGNISTRTSSGLTYREPTSGFFYNLMRNNLRWVYQKPSGNGSSPVSPYRLTDFAGYNHNSPCPLPYSFTRTLYVTGATDTKATYNLDCDIRTPDEVVVGGLNLPIMELPSAYANVLPNLGKCYLGVLFYDIPMGDCFWQCSGTQLEALYNLDVTARAKALRVSFTDADFTNQFAKNHKNWKTRAFLCSKSLGYCETLIASQGHYIIACDEDAATCTLAISSSIVIDVFTANKAGTRVNVVIEITNNTRSAKTLITPKVELVAVGTGVVDSDYTWSNTAIGIGETITLNHTFTGIIDNTLNAHFTASYSGGSLEQTISVRIK